MATIEKLIQQSNKRRDTFDLICGILDNMSSEHRDILLGDICAEYQDVAPKAIAKKTVVTKKKPAIVAKPKRKPMALGSSDRVLAYMKTATGPSGEFLSLSITAIAYALKLDPKNVSNYLGVLSKKNLVKRVDQGIWRVSSQVELEAKNSYENHLYSPGEDGKPYLSNGEELLSE